MVRTILFCAVMAFGGFATASQAAVSGLEASAPRSPALQEKLFSTSFIETKPDGMQYIVNYRWIDPGKVYELSSQPKVGLRTAVQWTIYPDGSMSGKGTSGDMVGYIDAAGLPARKATIEGKDYEVRQVPTGDGYTVVLLQNEAAPGQPAQWKELDRAERRPLSIAETNVLLAQWRQEGPSAEAQDIPHRPTVAEDAEALRRHLAAIASGQPLYKEMKPQSAEAVARNLAQWRAYMAKLGPVNFVRFVGVDDKGVGQFTADHAYQGATWKVAFDQAGNLAELSSEPQPKRNEYRQDSGKHSFGNPTLDDLPLNQVINAFLEPTDGKTTGRGWRTDCYRVRAPVGKKMRLSVYTGGGQTFARLVNGCDDWERRSWVENDITTSDFGIRFSMPEPEIYVVVHGEAPGRAYRVYLNELTPAEIAQWDEDQRQQRIAEQRREQQKASEPSMFGAMVRGLAMGLSGVDAPLMNADGSTPNTLDVLNAANAELARKNAISQAQLNATIAQAQAQGSGTASMTPQAASSSTNPQGSAPSRAGPEVASSPNANVGRTPATASQPATASGGPKTFRAKFWAGYVLTPDDDHNTMCESIFSFTVPAWNSSTEGRDTAAILDPLKPVFAAKCEAASGQKLANNPEWTLEDMYRPLELMRVRKGDHVVTMP